MAKQSLRGRMSSWAKPATAEDRGEAVRGVPEEVKRHLVQFPGERHRHVEASAGTQDPVQLGEHGVRVGDVLEHLRAQHAVVGLVADGQVVRGPDVVDGACARVHGVLPVGALVVQVVEQLSVGAVARADVDQAASRGQLVGDPQRELQQRVAFVGQLRGESQELLRWGAPRRGHAASAGAALAPSVSWSRSA